MSTTRFLVLNGIVWPLFLALTVTAIFGRRLTWFPTAFATVILVNASLHVLGTLATSSYSPGLVTGVLLYVPSGIATLVFSSRSLAPAAFRAAVVVGVLIHALVIVIAFA